MFSARMVSMLMEPFNKVIISRYIGLSEVAYYELALRGAGQLRSLYEMGLKSIMPKISELQQKTQDIRKYIINIHKKSINFILIFALPAFLGLFIFSKLVLSLWLGDSYDPQISMALRWFLFGYMINLLSVPNYYIFMGIGHVKYCFLAHLIISVCNIVIISFFIILNTMSLSLFVSIHSFSIIISAIVMISLFTRLSRRVSWLIEFYGDTTGAKAD